jgi:hypothetical protein
MRHVERLQLQGPRSAVAPASSAGVFLERRGARAFQTTDLERRGLGTWLGCDLWLALYVVLYLISCVASLCAVLL